MDTSKHCNIQRWEIPNLLTDSPPLSWQFHLKFPGHLRPFPPYFPFNDLNLNNDLLAVGRAVNSLTPCTEILVLTSSTLGSTWMPAGAGIFGHLLFPQQVLVAIGLFDHGSKLYFEFSSYWFEITFRNYDFITNLETICGCIKKSMWMSIFSRRLI